MSFNQIAALTGIPAGPSKTRRGGGRHTGALPVAPKGLPPASVAPKATPATVDTHLSNAMQATDPAAKRKHLFAALSAHNKAHKPPKAAPTAPTAPTAATAPMGGMDGTQPASF